MSTEDLLKSSIDNRDKVEIVYNGGSQPGTVRTITPISIKNDKLRAYCHLTGETKQFFIDKIELSEIKSNLTKPYMLGSQYRHYETVGDLLREKSDSIKKLGWSIESSCHSISLHKISKKGKSLKSYDIKIEYDELTYDMVMDLNGDFNKVNIRQKQRPWTIRSNYENTRTFKNLDSAISVCMELAEKHAPVQK